MTGEGFTRNRIKLTNLIQHDTLCILIAYELYEKKTIRLRESSLRDKKANEEGKQVSEVLREIVEAQRVQDRAIEEYQKGLLSQGAAAEKAGLTIQEFHQELKRRGFVLRMDVRLIEAELEDL